MAKRKAGAPVRSAHKEPLQQTSSSKLAVNHYDDIADSEDEYLLQRDEILLEEGPEAKRRRRIAEDEALLEPSDEEVLDYDEDSAEDEDDDDDDDDLDEDIPAPSSKKRGKNLNSDSEEDEDVGDAEEGDEYGDWEGNYYGADAIETEEAALAEETEARRLQQKQLQRINAADFGFDEEEWASKAKKDEIEEDGQGGNVVELLPQLEVSEDMSPEERLKLLRSRYPEFEMIRREFEGLQGEKEAMARDAARAEVLLALRETATSDGPTLASHPAILRHQALSAYLGVMVMYFAVLSSTATKDGRAAAMAPLKLRDHPVMQSLLQMRGLWQKVKDLPVPDIDAEIKAWKSRVAVSTAAPMDQTLSNGASAGKTNGVSPSQPAVKKAKLSKSEREAALLQQQSSARRAERLAALEDDFASLSKTNTQNALRRPKSKSKATTADQSDSDLGDAATLLPHELADKAQRRKTLQFYTSQIAQKANKRGAAGRDAGGDIDLPHRERWKDKQARLEAEAERRAGGGPSQNADAPSTNMAVEKKRKADNNGSEEDDYYQTITTKKSAHKAAKTAAAHAYSAAQATGGRVIEQETVGPDGKRAITYAIEKNKGLTPHRKKENRNPRVKKRMKFEEKKKKLGSVRAVYKGGEGRGGYGGELSGIKSGLVKSVKL